MTGRDREEGRRERERETGGKGWRKIWERGTKGDEMRRGIERKREGKRKIR